MNWATLSRDVLENILLFSHTAPDVVSAGCVCTSWREILSGVWKLLYRQTFLQEPSIIDYSERNASVWRSLFEQHFVALKQIRTSLSRVLDPASRALALSDLADIEQIDDSWVFDELQRHICSKSVLRIAAERAMVPFLVRKARKIVLMSECSSSPTAHLFLEAALCLSLVLDFGANIRGARATLSQLGELARIRLLRHPSDAKEPFSDHLDLTAFLFSLPTPELLSTNSFVSTRSILEYFTLKYNLDGETDHHYGVGFRGATGDAFSSPASSSLVSLLESRTGLPIALSVLHIAVAAAAGLTVTPCALPSVFMTQVGGVGAAEHVFFDVFHLGKARNLAEIHDWLRSLGVDPATRGKNWLTEPSVRAVFARMLNNILNLVLRNDFHTASFTNFSKLAIFGCALEVIGENIEIRLFRLMLAIECLELETAEEDLAFLEANGMALHLLERARGDIQRLRESLSRESNRL